MGTSGGGGGGNSGKVDYPEYMKTWHEGVLGTPTSDIGAVIDAKISNSPFAALTAYDPDTRIAAIEAAVDDFHDIVANFDEMEAWADYVSTAKTTLNTALFSTTTTDDAIEAYNAIVDAELNNVVLPRFRRGMQDINAVNSSSFVVGAALIEAEADRDKDKFAADINLQFYKEKTASVLGSVDIMSKLAISKLDINRAVAQAVMEGNRISIIAKKEETDQDIHLSELDGRWDLEIWNYAGNMLASIGSASVRTGQQTPPIASALGAVSAGMTGIGALMMGASMIP